MVSATGAGPEPIPCKALTAQKLADAILYCLSPQATLRAQVIAERMHRENGVQRAVQSFHAHLPQKKMRCDLLLKEPAVWKIRKGKRVMKISKKAAGILKNEGHVQEKDLKRYVGSLCWRDSLLIYEQLFFQAIYYRSPAMGSSDSYFLCLAFYRNRHG